MKQFTEIQLVKYEQGLLQKDTADWVKARNLAFDMYYPNRIELMKVFERVMLNDDVYSAIETRDLQVKGLEFGVRDIKTAKEQDDLAMAIKSEWFDEVCDLVLKAKYYAYSVFELSRNHLGEIRVTVFDRSHFIPHTNKYIPNLLSTSITEELNEAEYPFLIYYRPTPRSLGLLDVAVPLVFPAQYVLPAHAEHAERFGFPYVLGRTNVNNPKAVSRMNDIVQNIANGSSGVFDKDETIELIESAKNDPHNIYESILSRCERKLVKLFAGQTLTSSTDGTFGQAKVHLDISDDYTKADLKKLLFALNKKVIPVLTRLGLNFNGKEIYVKEKERITMAEKFDMVTKALQYYDIPEDYILREFKIPVSKKVTPYTMAQMKKKNLTIQVDNLYKNAHIHTKIKQAVVPDAEIKALIDAIKNGDIKAGDVPADLLRYIADFLKKKVEAAYGMELANADLETKAGQRLAQLIANAEKFAAYKTYKEVAEMAALPDNEDFDTTIKDIAARHNVRWLEVEGQTATMQSHSARQWIEFEDNEDFPNWRYETAGDAAVRDEHARLDGTVFSKSDTATQKYFPPLGYGCRCDAQEVSAKVKPSKDIPNVEIHPLFQANPGITGEAFIEAHPYFKDVPKTHQKAIEKALDNYRNS